MKRVIVGIGLVAALCFAASSRAQTVEAPIPQPPSAPGVPQPLPDAPPPPSIPQPGARTDMPSPPAPAAQQGATQRPEPRPPRSRTHARRRAPVNHVDRSAADAFTQQLNQRELESLEPRGGMPRAGAPGPPGRDLYPPE